ncbi:MAG: hypothetical protein NTW84_01385 [Methanothrix sp.]|jgi:hypothetical protein|nr:hypothetical protein [Methanothrix sp.]
MLDIYISDGRRLEHSDEAVTKKKKREKRLIPGSSNGLDDAFAV